jgi:hypothetical protein
LAERNAATSLARTQVRSVNRDSLTGRDAHCRESLRATERQLQWRSDLISSMFLAKMFRSCSDRRRMPQALRNRPLAGQRVPEGSTEC